MTFFYAAQAFAQLLLNLGSPKTVLLFALTSILCSLSIVPVSFTHVQTPLVQKSKELTFFQLFRLSSSGMITCFIAGAIFALTGILIIYLKAIGKLSMGNLDDFTKIITNTGNYVNQYTQGNMAYNILFILVLGLFIYYLIKKL